MSSPPLRPEFAASAPDVLEVTFRVARCPHHTGHRLLAVVVPRPGDSDDFVSHIISTWSDRFAFGYLEHGV
ncbi:hypothetical protein PR202_ga04453 [Eleusine coracana subsp. coracana]|uniref:Uncharacterized protein n=1 Tax=Eleusine coracana subsp. coracana TaxID=191504 RepID=A0AAV5BPY3_ELECO|nr:hypothetical protein PR202_ga04453 [Eleusine coracana subsp. coracana]